MSRVTKDIAKETALKMCERVLDEVHKAEKKLSDATKVIMDMRTPTEIKNAYEKFKDYFDTADVIYLKGHGFNSDRIELVDRDTFISNTGNYSKTIEVTEAEAKILTPLLRDFQQKSKDYNDVKASVETTLNSLKTYNRVKTHFPEAYEFLPEKTSTALALPVDDIMQKLNQYAGKTTEAGK